MTERTDTSRSKVGRLLKEYEMTGLGQELEDRWLGRGYKNQSLRDLADWFNKRLIEQKFKQVDETPIDGEVANLYRLLSDEDVMTGKKIDARATLERNDIDPETLQNEFVSHQAIHTYLTEFRNVSKERSAKNRLESARRTIQRLQNRLVAVVESNLHQLRKQDELTLGEFNVLVDVQILCEDCGGSYSVSDLFDRGGCDCERA